MPLLFENATTDGDKTEVDWPGNRGGELQIAGQRISCRLSDSTAGALTCKVSVEGHYYA